MKSCFVVCPIGPDGSNIRKRSDKLFKHIISPVCSECGFLPLRIDHENTSGSITEGILKHLSEDDLVIADITDSNANAFYEIGYRAALCKPAIHLMEKDSDIPFDVSAIRAISYDLTDLDCVEETKLRLKQTIQSMNFDKKTENNQSLPNDVGSLILQEVFKLQDSVAKLTALASSQNNAAVSLLADKLATAGTKTPETVAVETLITKMLESPAQLLKFVEITKQLPSQK